MDSSTGDDSQKKKNKPSDDDNDGKQLVSHQLPPDDGPVVGAFVITCVLACLSLGPLVPLLILLVALLGYWRIAATLTAVIVASMVGAEHSSRWCRFYLKAAGFFHNGVFLHFEKRAVAAFGLAPSMWCMHPHGTAMGFGFSLNGAVRFRAECPDRFVPVELQEVLTTARQLTCDGVMAPILFLIPLVRSLLIGFGCCTPATKRGMHSLFKRNIDFGLLPGGMDEVLLYRFQQERVYLSKRAGFIKYALQHGYVLLPAYTFGECDLYQSMTSGSAVRMWMQRNLGFVVPIFWGPLWYAPWLPRRDVALHTVIGAPVQLPRIENPSEQEIRTWHQRYIAALTEVFETHKARFGYSDRKLEVV